MNSWSAGLNIVESDKTSAEKHKKAKETLKYSLSRRKPEPSLLVFLDSGFRLNDELTNIQRLKMRWERLVQTTPGIV